MRDRLIELLNNFKYECLMSCKDGFITKKESCDDCVIDQLADYLLANGIIVPPCKVGQVLFVIESGRIIESKVKEYEYSSNSQNGVHWHIIFEELFAMSEAHIGKTVFYTRKEAMQALRDGVQ